MEPIATAMTSAVSTNGNRLTKSTMQQLRPGNAQQDTGHEQGHKVDLVAQSVITTARRPEPGHDGNQQVINTRCRMHESIHQSTAGMQAGVR